MTVFILTTCYAPPRMTQSSMEHFYNTNKKSDFDRHILLDPGYPLPNLEENILKHRKIANDFDLEYHQVDNRGCHGNRQYVVEKFGLKDDDILVFACPDVKVTGSQGDGSGWINAVKDVLDNDPDCFGAHGNQDIDQYKQCAHVEYTVGNQTVWKYTYPKTIPWSAIAYRMRWINEAGGIQAYNKWYGYEEFYLEDKLTPRGKRWYVLRDFYDEVQRDPQDDIFEEWKQESADWLNPVINKKTNLSFEEWLEKKEIIVISNKEFNNLAQINHVMAGLLWVFIPQAFDIAFPTWWVLLGTAIAGIKEFWYDEKYESTEVRGSSIEDFVFYNIGILIGVILLGIFHARLI